MKAKCMDVARFMVRTRCLMVINEFLSIEIVGEIFRIKITEDHLAPMRMSMKAMEHVEKVNVSSSDAMSSWRDGVNCL